MYYMEVVKPVLAILCIIHSSYKPKQEPNRGRDPDWDRNKLDVKDTKVKNILI
jgi:hypothetical protein